MEFEHGEVLFSAKNEGFSLSAGDEMGLASPPAGMDLNQQQMKMSRSAKEPEEKKKIRLLPGLSSTA